jgi:hypothetical protein
MMGERGLGWHGNINTQKAQKMGKGGANDWFVDERCEKVLAKAQLSKSADVRARNRELRKKARNKRKSQTKRYRIPQTKILVNFFSSQKQPPPKRGSQSQLSSASTEGQSTSHQPASTHYQIKRFCCC